MSKPDEAVAGQRRRSDHAQNREDAGAFPQDFRGDLRKVVGLFKGRENFFGADDPLFAIGAGGKAEEPIVIEVD